jgi:uncharacterized protein
MLQKKRGKKQHKKSHKASHKREIAPPNKSLFNIALFVSLFIIVGSISLFFSVVIDEKSVHVTTVEKRDTSDSDLEKLFTKMDKILKEHEDVEAMELFSEIKDFQNSLPPMESEKAGIEIIKKEPVLISQPKSVQKIQRETEEKKVISKRPKLAIIIDDVGSATQIKRIQSTGLKLNMALFPPTKAFPNTPIYAKELPFYMIHLPLEAMKFNKPQDKTLLSSSSKEEVKQRIAEVRAQFPKSHYINNHTGSKFTSDKQAMKYLFTALNEYDYKFVDSRTSAQSKVRELVGEYHLPLLERDVFIDNKDDVAYIEKQLQKAIKIALRHGQAIAIGHPHKSTIQAIKNSKKYFEAVELVYVTEL